ncbi:MAG: signal peptidase I [Actinobacteria bacterium]|nr:signal peptidase I [Actinomycetota bacterium]
MPDEPSSSETLQRDIPAAEDRPVGKSAAPDGGTPPKSGSKKRSRLAFLTELPALLFISLALALVIKTFVFQAFYIPSESMLPTLEVGDRVLVNKVGYRFHPPRRGDIIVFEDPNPGPEADRSALSDFWHWLTEGLGVSSNPEKDFIKRVIGLPGETVEIRRGTVYIDGRKLPDEPYVSSIADTSDSGPFEVPPEQLFVMGDNRTASSDSRTSLSYIPYDRVIGRTFVIIWPPSSLRWVSGLDYALAPAALLPLAA